MSPRQFWIAATAALALVSGCASSDADSRPMTRLPARRSLRAQLAIAGFAAIYVPVLVPFFVTYLTDDVSVNTVNGVEVAATSTDHTFGWVETVVIALAPVAAGLAWWWAGRAVRPIERIRAVAEHIEAHDLSERIALRTGPTEIASLAASFDAMLDRHPADLMDVVRTVTAELRPVAEAALVTIDLSGPPVLAGAWTRPPSHEPSRT